MLTVEHLGKTFVSGFGRRVKAVRDVSFHIKAGTTFGLMGNSGCGKTTLSRMILRLLDSDCGRILFDGQDITHLRGAALKALRCQMQLVFQHPESSLNPQMTLLENLLEPLRIHRLYDKNQRERRIRERLEWVGLSETLLNRYPHEISGGEAQRAVIARALGLDVRFFILDEPTSMLDVSVQAQIMRLFSSLQRRLGLTYLLISHDLEVVRWLSQEIAFMHEGAIVEQGPTEQVLAKPSQEFTRTLIRSFQAM